MVNAEIVESLRTCELFAPLGDQEVEGLAGSLQLEAHEAGDTIFAQGEHSTRLYVVVEGQVLLERSSHLGD